MTITPEIEAEIRAAHAKTASPLRNKTTAKQMIAFQRLAREHIIPALDQMREAKIALVDRAIESAKLQTRLETLLREARKYMTGPTSGEGTMQKLKADIDAELAKGGDHE